MRELRDSHGNVWMVIAIPTPVAHVRRGARLAFQAAHGGGDPLLTQVTFNSAAAAGLAIRNMSEAELHRRLSLASEDARSLPNDRLSRPPAPLVPGS